MPAMSCAGKRCCGIALRSRICPPWSRTQHRFQSFGNEGEFEMNEGDSDSVRQSFSRCTLTDGFLVTFYEILASSSDEIRGRFAHTDMPRQRRLLKEALVYLISYPTGNAFAQSRVNELGNSHSRTNLNIRPEWYTIWVDSLMQAIRRYDAMYSPELDAAWRRVLAPGIAAMKSHYDADPAIDQPQVDQ